jgi:hypothetical protein
MIVTTQSWKKLFLFCFGLAAGVSFCMKWMEADFWAGNEKFTILGLELFYTKDKVAGLLAGLGAPVKMILRYHLWFDFAFTAGVYPCIAALCMMAKEKARAVVIKKVLYALAALQLIAWTADIIENCYLLSWIRQPLIDDKIFRWYHAIVLLKWIIIIAALLVSIPMALRKNKSR